MSKSSKIKILKGLVFSLISVIANLTDRAILVNLDSFKKD